MCLAFVIFIFLRAHPLVASSSLQNPKNFSSQNQSNVTKKVNDLTQVFKREHLNESREKIQFLNEGFVVKSAFVPILPNNYSLANSTVENRQVNFLQESNDDGYECGELMALKVNTIDNPNKTSAKQTGKKYKVIKLKRNSKRFDGVEKNQWQKKSFKISPNFWSFFPIDWVMRDKKNEALFPEKKSEIQWTKLNPIQTTINSGESLVPVLQNSEKIRKLLNLFTILKFDNKDCYSNNVKGTCLHQSECESNGGTFKESCAGNVGVCCYYEKTCGQNSKENNTYFVNEDFPESSTAAPKVCTLTIEKTDSDVQQLRLDFLIFQLRSPINGTCFHDKLVVTNQDTNDVVPEICGFNTGQHIYIDVEESDGPFGLNVITVGEYFPRNFQIKVTQLKKSDAISPKNCLQYYTEPTGAIQSFNYRASTGENLNEIESGYFNNLNYAICIKKEKGFCSITYENEEFDEINPSFQLVNVDEDGNKLLPPKQAGVETFDCPDDYIIVNGIRLCGEKLNDASVEIDFTKNYPVKDSSNGPFIFLVKTDATVSGRGFFLKYTQNPCFY